MSVGLNGQIEPAAVDAKRTQPWVHAEGAREPELVEGEAGIQLLCTVVFTKWESHRKEPPLPNSDPKKLPYYNAYEDRYRRVYAQGVDFWTAHPEEISDTTESLDTFLKKSPQPDPLILECGCGEGHLAEHLIKKGFRYIGVDISPSGIKKAMARTYQLDAKTKPNFLIANTTALDLIEDASVDIIIDHYHFHMLVTDNDRQSYLKEANRVLRSEGLAYFRENLQAKNAMQSVASFDEYLAITSSDFTIEEDREAWQDGKAVRIKLPRVPARANSLKGYISELETAGFEVYCAKATGSTCVIHARKAD